MNPRFTHTFAMLAGLQAIYCNLHNGVNSTHTIPINRFLNDITVSYVANLLYAPNRICSRSRSAIIEINSLLGGAVLLAAFLMHGYRPGPLLMNETPEFLYQVCIYLAASAIIMWFFSLILARFTVRILGLKKIVLMPVIFVLCVVGSYVINYNMFDVKVMFVFGILGFIMSELHFPAAPFLLGVILGPMADSNLRRALNISNGSIMPMFERPICLVFMAMILVLILAQIGVFRKMKQAWKGGR